MMLKMVRLFIAAIIMTTIAAVGIALNLSAETTVKNKGASATPNQYPMLEEIQKHPLKPPDTSSPRATLKSFLANSNEAYRIAMSAHQDNLNTPGLFASDSIRQRDDMALMLLRRAVSCLDMSEVPEALKESWGIEGALFLKEILDRMELPPWEEIPGPEHYRPDDTTHKGQEISRWRLPNTQIAIAKVREGPRQGEFLFAPEIISQLDQYINKVKHLPYREDEQTSPGFLKLWDSHIGSGLLPAKWSLWLPSLSQKMYLYNTLWQWCLMGGLLITLVLFFGFIYRWWNKMAAGMSSIWRIWGRAVIVLGASLGVNFVLHILADYVHIGGPTLMVLNLSMKAIAIFLYAWVVLMAGRAVGKTIVASPKIDPRGINAGLIQASCVFISFIAAGALIVFGIADLGVSLLSLLTGLGVGGLAVALAARPTLENLIGGFMILLDKPYRIGQRVMVKGYDGNVEKVGWRSTQIRLRSGPQVTIPNEEMARLDIENIDRRPFIRRKTNITVTYDTPPEKIEKAVELIQEILEDHEGMDPDWPPWVFFDEFTADSLNIVVIYWFHPPDLFQFYGASQKINLQIIRAFEKEGIEFAFPTMTSYLTQDDGQRLQVDITSHSPQR